MSCFKQAFIKNLHTLILLNCQKKKNNYAQVLAIQKKIIEKYTKTIEVNNDTHVYRLLYGSYLILKL